MKKQTSKKKVKDETSSDQIDCFVIMPITVPKEHLKSELYTDPHQFKLAYEYIHKPAIIENNWNPIYPKTRGSKVIIADIIDNLVNSEMVLCDISILNPNVFYEAGIRTALNKPIAFVKDEKISDIPFDTSNINHETYQSSLRPNTVELDVKKISKHLKITAEVSKSKNTVWEKFGLNISADQPVISGDPINARLELLLEKVEKLEMRDAQDSTELVDELKPISKPLHEIPLIKTDFTKLFKLLGGIYAINLDKIGISQLKLIGRQIGITNKELYDYIDELCRRGHLDKISKSQYRVSRIKYN